MSPIQTGNAMIKLGIYVGTHSFASSLLNVAYVRDNSHSSSITEHPQDATKA